MCARDRSAPHCAARVESIQNMRGCGPTVGSFVPELHGHRSERGGVCAQILPYARSTSTHEECKAGLKAWVPEQMRLGTRVRLSYKIGALGGHSCRPGVRHRRA